MFVKAPYLFNWSLMASGPQVTWVWDPWDKLHERNESLEQSLVLFEVSLHAVCLCMHLCLHIWLSRCANALCKACVCFCKPVLCYTAVCVWICVLSSWFLLVCWSSCWCLLLSLFIYLIHPWTRWWMWSHLSVCVYTSYMIPPAAYSFVFMPVLPALLKISLKLAHLLLHPLLDSLPPLWTAPPCHEMHATPAAHSTWRANQLPAEPKQGYSQWACLAVQYANEV